MTPKEVRDKELARKRRYREENPEKVKASSAKWREKNADHIRQYNLSYRYGLSAEKYAEILGDQGGLCAICRNPPSEDLPLRVDHDHSCCPGQKTCGDCLRALICHTCNVGLGAFYDDASLLMAAQRYLEQYSREV